jgi:hypothetical protein
MIDPSRDTAGVVRYDATSNAPSKQAARTGFTLTITASVTPYQAITVGFIGTAPSSPMLSI